MNDYYDYLDKRTTPKLAYPAATVKSVNFPPLAKSTKPEAAMTVEESDASETVIARVKAFWRK